LAALTAFALGSIALLVIGLAQRDSLEDEDITLALVGLFLLIVTGFIGYQPYELDVPRQGDSIVVKRLFYKTQLKTSDIVAFKWTYVRAGEESTFPSAWVPVLVHRKGKILLTGFSDLKGLVEDIRQLNPSIEV
jgi:hypothetical protein